MGTENFGVLLVDMNGTFMFGGDRFSPDEDYAATYSTLGGGELDHDFINTAIWEGFSYLAERYPDPAWHNKFPTVSTVFRELDRTRQLPRAEQERLEKTFALHECGRIPANYAEALKTLRTKHKMALVADIWAYKQPWLRELARVDVLPLFDALIFSSDGSSVKPSPAIFLRAVDALNAELSDCLVIGDSARRDAGGAKATGVACALVGSERDSYALMTFPTLLEAAHR